jgi:hypothetical protein
MNIRQDTAKQYRIIRRILKRSEPIKTACDCSNCEMDDRVVDSAGWYFIWLSLVFGLCLIAGCFEGTAHAYSEQDAIKAVIGEAEGEGYKGMLAVAGALRNRGTLHGVYGLHAPRVIHHRYSQNTLRMAARAWEESKHRDISNGARYWEGTRFPLPYWAKGMRVTAVIGRQKFFNN